MTEQQKIAIEKYRKEFQDNCKSYSAWGSARDCNFKLYKSENPEDENYTMVITSITGLSDDFQTYVETINLMVEPDGNVLNLTDVYAQSQVVTYIQQLKLVDNG
jgi:hypothetical protein